jgi:hypothetical protein
LPPTTPLFSSSPERAAELRARPCVSVSVRVGPSSSHLCQSAIICGFSFYDIAPCPHCHPERSPSRAKSRDPIGLPRAAIPSRTTKRSTNRSMSRATHGRRPPPTLLFPFLPTLTGSNILRPFRPPRLCRSLFFSSVSIRVNLWLYLRRYRPVLMPSLPCTSTTILSLS